MANAKGTLVVAKTVDETWVARWKIRVAEKNLANGEKAAAKAEEKMEKLCPGGKITNPEDLPLLELRAVEAIFWKAQREPKRLEQKLKELKPDEQKWAPRIKLELELAERQAVVA